MTKFVCLPSLAVCLVTSAIWPQPAARAELWRSPLHDMTCVMIEKKLKDKPGKVAAGVPLAGNAALESLPADVLAQAGPQALEYEAFLVTWLPAPAAEALTTRARGHGLAAGTGLDRQIHLPWVSFQPGDLAARNDPKVTARVPADPVPGLFLVQFAYPIQDAWIEQLAECGAERVEYYQQRTFLLKAPGLEALTGCPVARYLSWIDAFRTSDRVSAKLLDEPGTLGYWLSYIPGTDLAAKARELPGMVQVEETYESAQDRTSLLRVEGSLDDLLPVVKRDPDLLTIAPQSGWSWSDERQGQILAGLHDGIHVKPLTQVQHYRDWLAARGLLSASNQQIVAVIDTGFDDGTAPTPSIVDNHPDLENPERLEGIRGFTPFASAQDQQGHGTMVAGIIAGDGGAPLASHAVDYNGFYYGSGIAPGARIYAYKPNPIADVNQQRDALKYSRNRIESDSSDRALIANESWNELPSPGVFLPQPAYTSMTQFFDQRVLDANEELSGKQPMTIVFSAGNYAYDCTTQTVIWESVSSPANAKNVIAVGATENDRPAPEPPLACRGCFNTSGQQNGRPPDVNASHVGRVANFSGKGRFFGPYPNANLANATRIKPDLVAPAVRVFSTAPYFASGQPRTSYDAQAEVTGCAKYYSAPSTTNTFHTYGSGTSFAAPVVSGVSALLRKWFLDRGINPAPSLLKAALIATADTLGNTGLAGHDHRPSPRYGWGRVNLDRPTDSRAKFYATESTANSVTTGVAKTYQLRATDISTPSYIVLAWSDPAAAINTDPQAVLINDLSLTVAGGEWRGNIFNESITGVDDGFSYHFSVGIPASDNVNNVEAVFIPAGALQNGQALQVTVTGSNVPQGPQSFSLYAYNLQAN